MIMIDGYGRVKFFPRENKLSWKLNQDRRVRDGHQGFHCKCLDRCPVPKKKEVLK